MSEETKPALVEMSTVAEKAASVNTQNTEVAGKIIAFGSKIQSLSSIEEDKIANDFQVKINQRLGEMEERRKDVTRKVDEWKKLLMKPEDDVKKELERIKKLRNDFAATEAEKNKATLAAANAEKIKIQEIARIKNEMKNGVAVGLGEKIVNGEKAIAKLFGSMTLETFSSISSRIINIQPNLKEEDYMKWLTVPFDDKIVSMAEYKEIFDKAYEHFNFKKISDQYVFEVKKVVAKWVELLPTKKLELEKIANASNEEAELLRKSAENKAAQAEEERKRIAEAEANAIKQSNALELQRELSDSEFKAQVIEQSITKQANTRTKISYHIKDIDKTMFDSVNTIKIIQEAMMHVLAAKENLGILKRKKASNMPEKDENGRYIYVDGVQYWLDELAKLKPPPVIAGLEMKDDIVVVAKASK